MANRQAQSVYLRLYFAVGILLSCFSIFKTSISFSFSLLLSHEQLSVYLFCTYLFGFIYTRPWIDLIATKQHFERPILALMGVQFLLTLLIFANHRDLVLFYISDFPLFSAIFYKVLSTHCSTKVKLKECSAIIVLASLCQLIFIQQFTSDSAASVYAFLFVASVFKYIAFFSLFYFKDSLFGIDKRQVDGGESYRGLYTKENFFVHDMVNITHGLLLFISHRLRMPSRSEEKNKDLQMIYDEVKTLQSLFQDHYHFEHRNLVGLYRDLPVTQALTKISSMINYYLPKDKVKTKIIICGETSPSQEFHIYYPTFYRMMNNLVKNISDKRSEFAEFRFELKEGHLNIIIRNDIYQLNQRNHPIMEKLNAIILNEPEHHPFSTSAMSGLGLESINTLCSELGGQYTFTINEGEWINELVLPVAQKLKLAS